jgi:hypothetical protein
MIFFCVDVLRSLAFDSVEVAHRVRGDHGEEVTAARSTMRYLFPLASGQMNVEAAPLETAVAAAGKAAGKPLSNQNAPSQASKDIAKGDGLPAVAALELPRRSFWGFMGAVRGSHEPPQRAPPQADAASGTSVLQRNNISALASVPKNDDDSALLESDAIVDKAPFQRDLSEFGPPRYGLSPSAWSLLLRSYLGIEELARTR